MYVCMYFFCVSFPSAGFMRLPLAENTTAAASGDPWHSFSPKTCWRCSGRPCSLQRPCAVCSVLDFLAFTCCAPSSQAGSTGCPNMWMLQAHAASLWPNASRSSDDTVHRQCSAFGGRRCGRPCAQACLQASVSQGWPCLKTLLCLQQQQRLPLVGTWLRLHLAAQLPCCAWSSSLCIVGISCLCLWPPRFVLLGWLGERAGGRLLSCVPCLQLS